MNAVKTRGWPPQIAYIIGNEGCERFSFYGMKNILTIFMVQYFLLSEGVAKANYHLFVSACYFFPLLGGYLADRFFGKYRTIFWLSLLYCVGHACLAIFEKEPMGFYVGLGLIALGSGGIKPCVAAFVGDQFGDENKHLLRKVFALFYWMINFGSFFASLLIPFTLQRFGPKVAFGIPGVLMFIATVILWIGRARYVHVPPSAKNEHGFLAIVGDRLLGRARPHPAEAIAGVRATLRVMVLFLPIPIFWALFDQKGASWVLQAKRMDLVVFGHAILPSQILALNPLLVMILVPLMTLVVYPAIERRRAGKPLSAIGRMTVGMFIACLAFGAVGVIEIFLARAPISVLWQGVPYLLLTISEVLVSTTGLEFAYSQAPTMMKSTIMSFWNLTVTIGNLITALVASLNVFDGAGQFFFFAALVLLAAVVFGLLGRRFQEAPR